MSYTMYWNRPKKNHKQEAWDKFITDCKYLYKHMPKHSESAGNFFADKPLLLNGDGAYKNPVFNKDKVWFNGTGITKRIKVKDEEGRGYWQDVIDNVPDNLKDLGHETFILKRKYSEGDWTFCKTARKPYDLMVKACLILYKYYFSDVQISSDGDEEDWQQAWEFIACVLPKGPEVVTEMKLSNNLFERLYD